MGMEMDDRKKKIILLGTAVLIAFIIFVGVRGKEDSKETVAQQTEQEVVQTATTDSITKKESDGTVVNTSQKLNENKEIDGFAITNIKFTKKNGETQLVADVTNKTQIAQKGFLADVVLYDASGKEMSRIPASITPTQVGETIEIIASITEDYIGAYDFKLEKK